MTEETPWLSSEQEEAWRSVMAAILLLPGALDSQLQREAGLTHAGYAVLSTLSEAPEQSIRLSRLAAMASLSMSRLSHLVDRLEAAGWVQRRPVPGDGRSTMAVLTEAGYDKVARTAPGHARYVRSLVFDGLTLAQTRQLKRIFDTMLPRLDPEDRLRGGLAPAPRRERPRR